MNAALPLTFMFRLAGAGSDTMWATMNKSTRGLRQLLDDQRKSNAGYSIYNIMATTDVQYDMPFSHSEPDIRDAEDDDARAELDELLVQSGHRLKTKKTARTSVTDGKSETTLYFGGPARCHALFVFLLDQQFSQ